MSDRSQRIANLSPDKLALLSRLLEQKSQAPAGKPEIPRRGEADHYPLSFAQERLWFTARMDPRNSAYNIPMALSLQGPLNIAALEQSLGEIINRHEALRTTFGAIDSRPVQRISAAAPYALAVVDLSAAPEPERTALAASVANQAARRCFDLAGGPVLSAGLLRMGEQSHVLLLSAHHIVCDEWSTGILSRELMTAFNSFTSGQPSPLPELPIQYADFAVWQREWLQGSEFDESLAYWKSRLANLPDLDLPSDYARPAAQSFRGATRLLIVEPALTAELKRLGRQEEATPFMLLLATFKSLLTCYTGQTEITVGTDIANRGRRETEGLIGFFVNQLVLRTDVSGDPDFRQLLRRVRGVTLDAYAHQDAPFEKVVRAVNPKRDPSRTPLFQVKFVFQNASPVKPVNMAPPALGLETFEVVNTTAKFDLLFTMGEANDGLVGSLEYSADLFSAATIGRMLDHFQTVLRNVVSRPDIRMSELKAALDDPDRRRKADKDQRYEQARNRARRAARPKPIEATLSQEDHVRVGYLSPGQTLPLVIERNLRETRLQTWVRENMEFVESNLHRHGGILFRGFDMKSVDDFSDYLSAACKDLLTYVESATPRTELSEKIYTSTEFPAGHTIALHNELTYVLAWPMRIWFFCLRPAGSGGETPIADVRRVFNRISPQTRRMFIEKGWMLIRNFGDGLGLPWRTSFHTRDRDEAESYFRSREIEFDWKDADRLRTRQVRPAVARHPVTGEMVWFNHIAFWHVSGLEPALRQTMQEVLEEEDLPYNTYYGDGSPIMPSVIDEIRRAYDEETIAFKWQAGDVLMLDNMLVAHGRRPYGGERKILVAMGEPFGDRGL